MKRIILSRAPRPTASASKPSTPFSDEIGAAPRVAGVASAERLVGLGFRYWLTGFRTGDLSCWERTWNAYAHALGACGAKGAVTDLSCWVRAISRHARRDLETAAVESENFCRDECVAIAMIAACQHNACPAMRACAFSLLGCAMIDEVVEGAETFATTMRKAEQVLRPAYAPGPTLSAFSTPSLALQ